MLDDAPAQQKKCQNELAPDSPSSPFPKGEVARDETEGVSHAPDAQNCRNEPSLVTSQPLPEGEVRGLAHSEGFPTHLTLSGISKANLETRTWGGISMG